MRTKSITMRKSSGFQYSITVSVVDTPNGAIRTVELKDHEVMMADKEPTDTWIMTFNENSFDTNTKQLKEFCEFVLNEINKSKLDFPEVLTWKKEYTIEEQEQNLINAIKFAKANGSPILRQNIVEWENKLKNFYIKNNI